MQLQVSIRLSVIFVFWAILISGCGVEKEKEVSLEGGANRRDATPTLATTPISDATLTAMPVVVNAGGLSGKLIFTSHENLYTWDFSTQATPHEVMTQVEPRNFYAMPDQTIVFGAWDNLNHFSLYRYDLTTQESKLLYEFGRSQYFGDQIYWSINNVSPDMQWAMFSAYDFGYPLGLVALDGSQKIMKLEMNYAESSWTTDGRVVLTEYAFTQEGMGTLMRAYVVDPNIPTQTDITDEMDVAAINSASESAGYFAARDLFTAELAKQDITIAPVSRIPNSIEDEFSTYIRPPDGLYERSTDIEYCREWTIVKQMNSTSTRPDPQILYTDPTATTLQTLTPLQDGTYLFLAVHYPDCKFGTPTGELIRLNANGSADILAEGLASAADSDNAFWGHVEGERFIVSPDQSYVFYVRYDDYGQSTSLYQLNLATGENIALNMADTPIADIGKFMMIP